MGQSARNEKLSSKHADLDEIINKEMRSPNPDTLKISELKKQKLMIKDELTQSKKTG